MATPTHPLDTAALEAVLAAIAEVPDQVDGLDLAQAKSTAGIQLGMAINAVKSLRKLSTPLA